MAIHLVEHPLAHDALAELRDVRTTTQAFRRAACRISLILASEALRDVPVIPTHVTTPLAAAEGRVVRCDIVVVPVLRAGLGMLDAVLQVLPRARVGHIGLQRDEATARASQYYARLPSGLDSSYVLIVDPMLASGGSAVAAIDRLKLEGARTIRMICIIAAQDGVDAVATRHPDVEVYTPVIDRELDPRKFIVPGLGDFGDRLYGTE